MDWEWSRKDGRWFHCQLEVDLLGDQVLVVRNGGRGRSGRVRMIPVADVEEARETIDGIGKRRVAHGYERCPE